VWPKLVTAGVGVYAVRRMGDPRRTRVRAPSRWVAVWLSSAAAVLGLAGTSPARAQYAEMAELREHVRAGRWDRLVEEAEEFLDRDDLTAALRNGAIELLARGQLNVGDDAAARDALSMLYARDPNHQPGQDVPAEERRVFVRVRGHDPETVHVDLLHQPVQLEQRRAPPVEVRLSGASNAVARVAIFHRRGDGDYARLEAEPGPDGTVDAELPLASGGERYTAQYYLEARAPSGAILGRLATAVQPLEVVVPETGSSGGSGAGGGDGDDGGDAGGGEDSGGGGLFGQWWFWARTAVVLAGGGAAAYFLLSSEGQAADGSLGSVELLRFP